MRNTEDSAPYEKLCTQPMIDAEARQAENGCLSKRERRNEVRSERDRARSHDATAKKENKKAGVSPEREARAAKRSLEGCVRRTTPALFERSEKKEPAASYSRTSERRTTLGDGALDFRVRNGNGYFSPSMATGKTFGYRM